MRPATTRVADEPTTTHVVIPTASWSNVARVVNATDCDGRPASVTARRAEERKKIFAANPEFGSPDAPVDQLPEEVRTRLQAELQKMRENMVSFANAEVQRELRELVSKVAV